MCCQSMENMRSYLGDLCNEWEENMLSYPDIDDEEYGGIVEEALSTVINIYPEWTDFNAHDPGITILELFALMKESQQFFADQVSEENRRKYLKLLGMRRRHKTPAHSLVRIKPEEDDLLLQAHKIEAGNLCFETLRTKQVVKHDVCSCLHVCRGKIQEEVRGEQMEPGHAFRFPVFGSGQERDSQIYVCLGEGLPVGVPLELYIRVSKKYEIRRNPITREGFVPLVKLKWQYYSQGEWKDLRNAEDQTYGFLFDGFVRFTLEEPMEETCIQEETGYYLRVVFLEGAYDAVPILTGISMNICEVIQRETLVESEIWREASKRVQYDTELSVMGRSEVYIGKEDIFYPTEDFQKRIDEEAGCVCFDIGEESVSDADCIMVVNRSFDLLHRRVLGEGDGLPCQEIDLEDLQILYESFAILVRDTEEREGYRLWRQVEDFAGSSPDDRHYVLDSQKGILCFGDGRHGMAPEGEILLTGFARTKGSEGNVRKGASWHFFLDGLQGLELTNICEGFGGSDEETLEDSFLRAEKYLKEPECAVTDQDYERYVRQTPGLMIESCKVLSFKDIRQFIKKAEETAVHMVVKPYRWQKGSKIEDSYRQNIGRYLERYRMVGNPVILYFPEYVDVQVYVEAVVKPQYLKVEERVKQAVKQYLERYRNSFGSVVSYNGLYGYIDSQDFIVHIRSLSMEVRGNGARRNGEGDILLSPYGIAVLKGIKTSLTMG